MDSVIVDIMASLLPILNQKYDLNLKQSDITQWDYPIKGISIGSHIKSLLADPAFVLGMPEIEGAKEAMTELYKKHTLIVATGRPSSCKNSTLKWLDGRFLYDGIVFSREKTTEKLGCDLLIDDCFSYRSGVKG